MNEELIELHRDTIQTIAQEAAADAYELEKFDLNARQDALQEVARLAVEKTLEALDRGDLLTAHFWSAPETFSKAVLAPESYEEPAPNGNGAAFNIVRTATEAWSHRSPGRATKQALGVSGSRMARSDSVGKLERQGRL